MIRNLMLLCGPASSVLYLTSIDVVARRQHPEYHGYRSQLVSELFALGSPTRRSLMRMTAPYHLLVFAFAGGVWQSAMGRRRVKVAALMLAGYGATSLVGGLYAPMDLRGTPDSRRDRRHLAVTLVMSTFTETAMVLGAFAGGRRFRVYSLLTAAVAVAFAGLTGYLARPMPGPTPGVGLAERVNIYASMGWLGVLAAALWRQHGRR
ncbi:MAG: DUF998 domain-containing protein [Dehalococcoidia bacterium]